MGQKRVVKNIKSAISATVGNSYVFDVMDGNSKYSAWIPAKLVYGNTLVCYDDMSFFMHKAHWDSAANRWQIDEEGKKPAFQVITFLNIAIKAASKKDTTSDVKKYAEEQQQDNRSFDEKLKDKPVVKPGEVETPEPWEGDDEK